MINIFQILQNYFYILTNLTKIECVNLEKMKRIYCFAKIILLLLTKF